MGDQVIRVALGARGASRIGATAEWRWYGADGRSFIARADAGSTWRMERDGRRVRAVRPDGVPTTWEPALVARLIDRGYMTYNGKRYRGELTLVPTDSGVLVVNRAAIDDYLLGVVPLEIGRIGASDSAAIQAQAVAARSYAYTRISDDPSRTYDLTGGVSDQVYGGVEAENVDASRAVEATRGLVLLYAGRVVNAPYHSTCGGSTAAVSEVWHARDEPFLRPVSDRIPGTDRYYCDRSATFTWTHTLESARVDELLRRYLAAYTSVPGGDPGHVRDVSVDSRTTSGRVAALRVSTDRGNFTLRGNDIRFVLRPAGGAILESTYFSIEVRSGPDGSLDQLTLRGRGNGHGIGMCQWGAIGRARAGQDFRTILTTYYPGTTVGSP